MSPTHRLLLLYILCILFCIYLLVVCTDWEEKAFSEKGQCVTCVKYTVTYCIAVGNTRIDCLAYVHKGCNMLLHCNKCPRHATACHGTLRTPTECTICGEVLILLATLSQVLNSCFDTGRHFTHAYRPSGVRGAFLGVTPGTRYIDPISCTKVTMGS